MATVTSPIILDSTGQDIVTKLNAISTNLNKTASDIPYDANLTIKGKIDATNTRIDNIANGTIATLEPTTNETYASLIGRLRTATNMLSDGNYNFYILRFRPAGASSSSNLVFHPTRFVGNSVVEYLSCRVTTTAMIFYHLSITASAVTLTQIMIDNTGNVSFTDASNNTAQSGVRVMGLITG